MFVDRIDAGRRFAEKLLWVREEADKLKGHGEGNRLVILAIPRGGLIIGDVIASSLGGKLDIVVSRKIGAPFNQEFAIGAIMPDGTCFLNTGTVEVFQIPQQYIATKAEEQIKEINRRLEAYRGQKEYDNELEGKIVILVDDGIATGSTIYAAAQWVKAQKCRKLVIAVPVGPKDIIEILQQIADMVVVIDAPISFQAVGEFYRDFRQVTDEEVKTIMRRYGYKPVVGYSENFAG